MNISIFDVIGPVMIGPSSSHTAGAARLARIAADIAGEPFTHVSFALHGSFAKTGKGHGTDRALVAGALGLDEADERIGRAFELAAERGLGFDFSEVELGHVHENSVRMRFRLAGGGTCEVIGSSIGGGQVVIRRINGFDTEFSVQGPTLVIFQNDRKGIVSSVAQVLAENGINIGVMKLSREARGMTACCVIETDHPISDAVVRRLRALPDIISVQLVNARPDNSDIVPGTISELSAHTHDQHAPGREIEHVQHDC